MSLFGKQSTSLIGVDIGTSSIKLVELAHEEGRARLVTYGFIDQIQRDIRSTVQEDTTFMAEQIKTVMAHTKFTTLQAIAALPTYAVFTSLISLPYMSKEELDSAVHWEARKIIPLPLDEIVLDYQVLNDVDSGGMTKKKGAQHPDFFKILITGAAKDTVARYTEIFKLSGLNLVSLETEMFALSRTLVGDDPAEIMIVEMGATTTDIVIVENGIPFLSRTIETGGMALTRAIVSSLNISERRAEQLKRDIGIIAFDQQSGGVPKILEGALEPLVHEIKYTFNLYKDLAIHPSDTATGNIEKVILTGGTALMPNFVNYLSQILQTRVVVGDPWARVAYPEDLRPVLAGVGSKFSVALGLALRAPNQMK